MPELENLLKHLKSLGIECHDSLYYELAFTHSSVNGMHGTKHHDYERLEFLGDSLIGLVVSELAFRLHPEMLQGELSMLKASFIRTESEANYARKLGFAPFIRVGSSFQGDVSTRDNVLEDVFESFVGALFLDQGLQKSHAFLVKLFEEDIRKAKADFDNNPKSELQEAMQADYRQSVTYKILEESGPAHDRHYVAAVYFMEEEIGRGEGHSKKEAEVMAAKNALAKRVTYK